MRLIFSTSQIPQLQHLSVDQRQQALAKACKRLTPPEIMLLNLLKLMIVIPVFTLLVNLMSHPLNIIWAGLLLLAFPLLIRPVQCGLAAKYIHPDKQG